MTIFVARTKFIVNIVFQRRICPFLWDNSSSRSFYNLWEVTKQIKVIVKLVDVFTTFWEVIWNIWDTVKGLEPSFKVFW